MKLTLNIALFVALTLFLSTSGFYVLAATGMSPDLATILGFLTGLLLTVLIMKTKRPIYAVEIATDGYTTDEIVTEVLVFTSKREFDMYEGHIDNYLIVLNSAGINDLIENDICHADGRTIIELIHDNGYALKDIAPLQI